MLAHGIFPSSTFTHNMLAFGLNRKLCNDFLKKQAVIGNLDEGESQPEVGLQFQGPALCRPVSPPARSIAPVLVRSGANCLLGRPPLSLSTSMHRTLLALFGSHCSPAGLPGVGELPVQCLRSGTREKMDLGAQTLNLKMAKLTTSCPSF